MVPSIHPGSPLDLLPQTPSQMMIAPGAADAFGGDQVFQVECLYRGSGKHLRVTQPSRTNI